MSRLRLILLRWKIEARANLQNLWKHPINLWHWSTTWPWFAVLLLGGMTFVAVYEAVIGLILIFLSFLSLSSILWHTNRSRFLRAIGTIGICLLFVVFAMSTIAYTDEHPWSNLIVFWDTYVALKTIPASEMIRPMADAQKFPFPTTTAPAADHGLTERHGGALDHNTEVVRHAEEPKRPVLVEPNAILLAPPLHGADQFVTYVVLTSGIP
jgi:hypothetical protein